MKPTPHLKLLKIQRKIYRSLKADVTTLFGKTPKSIQRYEREHAQDFVGIEKSLRILKKEELIRAICASQVIFVADFHTHSQSQRTLLRLAREAIKFSKLQNEQWRIGLEMIPSSFQPELDQFQKGLMSLETFHRRIRYEEQWGFPWENYAPLFSWAKENGVKIIGINQPHELSLSVRQLSDLKQRDQWAAGVITDLFLSHKDIKVFVLYGELHVCSMHLIHQLREISKKALGKPLRSICIHQNNDRIYWQMAQKGREQETQVVKMRKHAFCVLSSPPWSKLHSLLSWTEGECLGDEVSEDYLAWMEKYATMIADFFGMEPPDFESLNIHTLQSAEFFHSLSQPLFSRTELQIIRKHIVHHFRIYIPRVHIAYLPHPSQNAVAELAAIHLFRGRVRSQEIFSGEFDDYFRMILESAFGFLGSLIVNPKRKCDLPRDYVKRYAFLKQEGVERFPGEWQAHHLALEIWSKKGNYPRLQHALGHHHRAFPIMISAKFVGQVLGKKLHLALHSGLLDPENIRHLIDKKSIQAFTKFMELTEMSTFSLLKSSKLDFL